MGQCLSKVEAQNDHSIKPNVPNHISNSSWFGGHFENLAVFGDNYTDESRLDYVTNHNNTPPPVGLLLPESLDASDGGRVWLRCTNNIVPRTRATPKDIYTAILETAMPAWVADSHSFTTASPGKKSYIGSTDNTLYAMWIGVNDIRKKNIFIDNQQPGTSLTTYTDCVFVAFDSIYRNGGRKFMSFKMYEYTRTVNEIFIFQVQFQQHIAQRYPGAIWAIYDINTLFKEIHQNPHKYLDGTSTLDVLDYIHHCSLGGVNCTDLPGDRDSYKRLC
ncbi:carbohydrate esterase family 16 protein [Trichoderma asperelloides]|nr:carbohydrate esterase family 16 protein [Trichoderma asperelloides]